jgi:hypothetical protein
VLVVESGVMGLEFEARDGSVDGVGETVVREAFPALPKVDGVGAVEEPAVPSPLGPFSEAIVGLAELPGLLALDELPAGNGAGAIEDTGVPAGPKPLDDPMEPGVAAPRLLAPVAFPEEGAFPEDVASVCAAGGIPPCDAVDTPEGAAAPVGLLRTDDELCVLEVDEVGAVEGASEVDETGFDELDPVLPLGATEEAPVVV